MASWHGRPGHDTELDRFVNLVSTNWTWLPQPVFSEQNSRAFGEERPDRGYGVLSGTFGKYILNRSWSAVTRVQPMICACAPMKKSGRGRDGESLPESSFRRRR